MKIAFIALKDLPYIGGMEKYTEEIRKRLVADGNEVVVYTIGRNSKNHSIYKGIKVLPVSTFRIRGLERLIASRIATLKATFINTGIIHFQSFENTLLTFIPKLFGKNHLAWAWARVFQSRHKVKTIEHHSLILKWDLSFQNIITGIQIYKESEFYSY